jgi:VanZ family protein
MLERISLLKKLAIVWLLLITILFFLPGSALPKEHLFGIPHFDKCVHFGFFALLIFLWRFYFNDELRYTCLLLVAAVVYGFGIEVMQHYFIANRSFDLGDVAADVTGAIAGIVIWQGYKKNRPL